MSGMALPGTTHIEERDHVVRERNTKNDGYTNVWGVIKTHVVSGVATCGDSHVCEHDNRVGDTSNFQ